MHDITSVRYAVKLSQIMRFTFGASTWQILLFFPLKNAINARISCIALCQHLSQKANELIDKLKLCLPSSKFSKSQFDSLHFSSSLFVLHILNPKTAGVSF